MTHANDTTPNLKEYTDTMNDLQFSSGVKERMAKRLAERSSRHKSNLR